MLELAHTTVLAFVVLGAGVGVELALVAHTTLGTGSLALGIACPSGVFFGAFVFFWGFDLGDVGVTVVAGAGVSVASVGSALQSAV